MYWSHLKIDGSMYIDDISWLPYLKDNWRDHKYTEKINYETFQKILEVFNSNNDNFLLDFNFRDSGMARLVKKSNQTLKESKKIKLRNSFIKSLLKNFKSFL